MPTLDDLFEWNDETWAARNNPQELARLLAEQTEQSEKAATITCPGCGYEYSPDEMAVLPTKVNLKDGTEREIHLCNVVCVEIWDDTAPGDWVELHSGEEVQRVLWQCDVCDTVWEYGLFDKLFDAWDYDPDGPVEYREPRESIVCKSCQKKERGRFKTRREVGQ